jgi:pyruvate formate lyase activating enzyme
MDVGEVLREVESDDVFYRRSGGGLTLSGGEALAQPAFALALLGEAKRRRVDTALETSGLVPYGVLAEAAGLLDALFVDLKHWDPARHLAGVGAPIAGPLENLRRLASDFPEKRLTVRTPLIPGYNDAPGDVEAIRRLIPAQADHELLPFHRLGLSKYELLGRDYAYREAPSARA